ncbi:hypothetical protein AFM16_22365 [Streptomyces antibioticus]|uniref:Uncharacterized protein n=1 Tax=Streptomyces antibioticus TaxID=1890 RepID=A0ABX3LEY8_STRAT|nr:hypothetical protein AFM16_22365 [Streptomyces antibioticus]
MTRRTPDAVGHRPASARRPARRPVGAAAVVANGFRLARFEARRQRRQPGGHRPLGRRREVVGRGGGADGVVVRDGHGPTACQQPLRREPPSAGNGHGVPPPQLSITGRNSEGSRKEPGPAAP